MPFDPRTKIFGTVQKDLDWSKKDFVPSTTKGPGISNKRHCLLTYTEGDYIFGNNLKTAYITRSLKKGFFGSLFAPAPIEVQSSSHSAKLSAKDESMIELQTHNVKPDSLGTIHLLRKNFKDEEHRALN